MKRETKIISILASAIFALSLILMAIPSALNSSISYEERDDEYSDYFYGNTAYMFGFGTAQTSISVVYEGDMDKETYEFFKTSYQKFEYLDDLGSVDDSKLSVNNIYDINGASVDTRVEINEELYKILTDSEFLFDASNGIFDITAGKIFDEVDGFVKSNQDYDLTPYLTGFNTNFEDRLLLEEVDSKYYASRTHEHTKVNLGGYLKGYFTEYVRANAKNYFDETVEIFVNSGRSSMTYIGVESKDMTLASPRDAVKCSAVGDPGCPGKWIGQNNWHVATSGDYNQYREDGDEIIHHLVDPRDGTFVQNRGLVSTLSNDYVSFLDALSSIMFIADPSEYQSILSNFSQEIDIVYLTTNTEQNDFTVDYIQSTSEVKFEIGNKYLPREAV